MAFDSKKHCPRPGHKAYFGRRCPECERIRDKERGSGSARGYDVDWRRFRILFLNKNPFCCVEDCGEKATQIDHVVTLRDGGERFDEGNLRAMCAKHHSQRTGRDQVRVGRK